MVPPAPVYRPVKCSRHRPLAGHLVESPSEAQGLVDVARACAAPPNQTRCPQPRCSMDWLPTRRQHRFGNRIYSGRCPLREGCPLRQGRIVPRGCGPRPRPWDDRRAACAAEADRRVDSTLRPFRQQRPSRLPDRASRRAGRAFRHQLQGLRPTNRAGWRLPVRWLPSMPRVEDRFAPGGLWAVRRSSCGPRATLPRLAFCGSVRAKMPCR